MTVKVAICDDDKAALGVIKSATESVFTSRGSTAEIECFGCAKDLWKRTDKTRFDLIMLDIEMPGIDGIAFGKKLRASKIDSEIIYVSGREDRVFESFDVHPFGFVRKNFFLKDITAVIDSYILSRSDDAGSDRNFVVQTKDGTVAVPINKIVYIEGDKKNQLLYLSNKRDPMVIQNSMEKLEAGLEEKGFMRVHKGFIVNCRFIRVIGLTDIQLSVEIYNKIPVSRRKQKEVKEKYLAFVQGRGSVIF